MKTILKTISKKLREFTIAFENERSYLILSDESLDVQYANEILSKIKVSKLTDSFPTTKIISQAHQFLCEQ